MCAAKSGGKPPQEAENLKEMNAMVTRAMKIGHADLIARAMRERATAQRRLVKALAADRGLSEDEKRVQAQLERERERLAATKSANLAKQAEARNRRLVHEAAAAAADAADGTAPLSPGSFKSPGRSTGRSSPGASADGSPAGRRSNQTPSNNPGLSIDPQSTPNLTTDPSAPSPVPGSPGGASPGTPIDLGGLRGGLPGAESSGMPGAAGGGGGMGEFRDIQAGGMGEFRDIQAASQGMGGGMGGGMGAMDLDQGGGGATGHSGVPGLMMGMANKKRPTQAQVRREAAAAREKERIAALEKKRAAEAIRATAEMKRLNREHGYMITECSISMPVREDAFGKSVWPLAREARVQFRFFVNAGEGRGLKEVIEVEAPAPAPEMDEPDGKKKSGRRKSTENLTPAALKPLKGKAGAGKTPRGAAAKESASKGDPPKDGGVGSGGAAAKEPPSATASASKAPAPLLESSLAKKTGRGAGSSSGAAGKEGAPTKTALFSKELIAAGVPIAAPSPAPEDFAPAPAEDAPPPEPTPLEIATEAPVRVTLGVEEEDDDDDDEPVARDAQTGEPVLRSVVRVTLDLTRLYALRPFVPPRARHLDTYRIKAAARNTPRSMETRLAPARTLSARKAAPLPDFVMYHPGNLSLRSLSQHLSDHLTERGVLHPSLFTKTSKREVLSLAQSHGVRLGDRVQVPPPLPLTGWCKQTPAEIDLEAEAKAEAAREARKARESVPHLDLPPTSDEAVINVDINVTVVGVTAEPSTSPVLEAPPKKLMAAEESPPKTPTADSPPIEFSPTSPPSTKSSRFSRTISPFMAQSMADSHPLPPLRVPSFTRATDIARAVLSEASLVIHATDFSDAGRSSSRRASARRQKRELAEVVRFERQRRLVNAATTLQRHLRGLLARRTVAQQLAAKKRMKQRWAARKIQKGYRSHLRRMFGADFFTAVVEHYQKHKANTAFMHDILDKIIKSAVELGKYRERRKSRQARPGERPSRAGRHAPKPWERRPPSPRGGMGGTPRAGGATPRATAGGASNKGKEKPALSKKMTFRSSLRSE